MRRRPKPAERVWRYADLPRRLAVFNAHEWGCTDPQWSPAGHEAWLAFHRAQRQWLVDHDVNVLEELQERRRRRREAMRQTP